MTTLPRAHTHPTTRPLTSLSHAPPPPHSAPRSRTALPSPAPSPARSPRSPQLRAIPLSALTSPLHEPAEDPFCSAGFFPPAEGFGWVRQAHAEAEGGEMDGDGEERLEGEDELGVEECVRRVLSKEDRMGVLGFPENLHMPELSHTPSSGSPPTPARYTPAYAYAYSHPRLHLDMDMDIDRSEALAEHGPETDDGLHESFAARTKAVSYPDLVMLARKRPAPPAARAGAGAGAARGLPGGGMRASRTPQERRRTELVYTRRETSVERRAGWEERGERTELGGLFFDGVSAQEKGEGVAVGGREGWRVWALDRAARAVGLD